MTSAVYVALQVDFAAAECSVGFSGSCLQGTFELFGLANNPHSAAAAPEGGLDDQRIADRGRGIQRLFNRGDVARGGRQQRKTAFLGRRSGGNLVAHAGNDFRCGSDEYQAGLRDTGSKFRVLAEQPIAGVNRLRPTLSGRLEDSFDVQIRVASGRAPDPDCLIGESSMQSTCVGIAVDGNATNTQLAAGAQHSHSDFASVGNQQAVGNPRSVRPELQCRRSSAAGE